jgi:hypothetical protein
MCEAVLMQKKTELQHKDERICNLISKMRSKNFKMNGDVKNEGIQTDSNNED